MVLRYKSCFAPECKGKCPVKYRTICLLKKKNNFSSIPELRQIQNFLYQMRKKFGYTNKIEDIKKYVDDRKFEHIQSDDELFFFGERFGDGSDEEHFSVGMTCLSLLKRLTDGLTAWKQSSSYFIYQLVFVLQTIQ